MRKADYTLLAQILKKYHTGAKLSALHGDEKQKIAAHWIAATCDCIAVGFTQRANVARVAFLRECTPD